MAANITRHCTVLMVDSMIATAFTDADSGSIVTIGRH